MKSDVRVPGLVLAVTAAALVVNFGVGLKLGMSKPMESDASYFLQLAQSVAAGKGYTVEKSFWPNQPSMRRFPGWPLAVASVLKLTGGRAPDAAMRATALAANGFAAGVLCLLTWMLFRRRAAAVMAGLAYAFHPAGLFDAYCGLSESFYVLVAATGVVLLMSAGVTTAFWPKFGSGGAKRTALTVAGFAVLGYAALVRSNFVLWIFFILGITLLCAAWGLLHRRVLFDRLALPGLVAGVVLFLLPATLWVLRNHRVSGQFPVLSTIGGQTFYGGNNEVVANQLEWWGYWVFPNDVPGETPMYELSRTMSEYEVDRYYMARGRAFVRANWFAMPRLLVGKLVRAYVPIPWRPSWGSYAVGLYRLLMGLGALLGLCLCVKFTPRRYVVIVAAMAMTNVFTVLVFYGYSRFAFALEPFLLPFAAAGVAEALRVER